jgi:hypothetical protein
MIMGSIGVLGLGFGSPIRVTQANDERRIVEIARNIFIRGMIYPWNILARIPYQT